MVRRHETRRRTIHVTAHQNRHEPGMRCQRCARRARRDAPRSLVNVCVCMCFVFVSVWVCGCGCGCMCVCVCVWRTKVAPDTVRTSNQTGLVQCNLQPKPETLNPEQDGDESGARFHTHACAAVGRRSAHYGWPLRRAPAIRWLPSSYG